jgi:phenylacetate-coenzyme A ligase PaaK-like adenylate-forming protein
MRYFNEKIETMPLAALRTLQNKNLRHQVAYLYEKVPFYRQKLDLLGIKPAHIKGVQDLYKLPFTKKSDLRDTYPFGLVAVPHDKINRIHCSSVGRADDMLIIRGVNFFHTQIEDVLKDIEHISPYYQVIVAKQGIMDEVEVKVEIDEKIPMAHPDIIGRGLDETDISNKIVQKHPILNHIHQTISKKIKENIGLSMKVTLSKMGDITRSEGGKLSRVLDKRKRIT